MTRARAAEEAEAARERGEGPQSGIPPPSTPLPPPPPLHHPFLNGKLRRGDDTIITCHPQSPSAAIPPPPSPLSVKLGQILSQSCCSPFIVKCVSRLALFPPAAEGLISALHKKGY